MTSDAAVLNSPSEKTELPDYLSSHQTQMQRHFRFNYGVTAIEGAFYAGGLAFIDPNVVLPRIVERLHGPAWLIAMIPLLTFVGMTIPQPFIAHWIEKLTRMKPYVLVMGTVQRFIFLATGLFVLFSGSAWPSAVLIAVALTPMVSGIFTGLHITAWQELVAKTIPSNRMSSLWAVRFIIGALLGMMTGGLVTVILKRFPGTNGYGILYCGMFVCALVSIITIGLTREPDLPPKRTDQEYGATDFLRSIIPAIRADRRLLYFVFVRIFSTGIYAVAPFIGIRALNVLGWPDSALGSFVSVQMVGSLCGFALGGVIGDTRGAKPVLILNHGLAILLAVLLIPASTPFAFLTIFFLFGAAMALNQSGMMPLGFQLCPIDKRIVYLTIISLAGLPGFALSWSMGTFGRSLRTDMLYLSLSTIVMMLISLIFIALISTPPGSIRRRREAVEAAKAGS